MIRRQATGDETVRWRLGCMRNAVFCARAGSGRVRPVAFAERFWLMILPGQGPADRLMRRELSDRAIGLRQPDRGCRGSRLAERPQVAMIW
jgi:hypothetical protein